MLEKPDRRALDAYMVMREAKKIEILTFKSALADPPDNPQSLIRQGISDLVDVLINDLIVLEKLIARWEIDARIHLMR